jgi:5'-3' exonuclease
MPHQTTIHLVDASPYIFRAYFSIPLSFTNPVGEQINAVYGFAHFLRRLQEVEEVTHLALAFDRSLNTSFRNEIYPPYKAQRDLPPPELVAQLDACQRLGEALGAATFADDRYEADDLIATLCRRFASAGHRIVVVSNDKDLAQLVTEQVTFFDFARDEHHDPASVAEKFGVRPAQITDYLGLAGDSVDNIPGVRGVGKKTAEALLAAYDDLEAIYEHLEEIPSLAIRGARSLRGKLEEHREMAFLSKELATLAFDAPAQATLSDLKFLGPQEGLLDPLVKELGFDPLRRGRS